MLEADVYYRSQVYHFWQAGLSYEKNPWYEVKDGYKYLDYEQEAECEVSDGSIFTSSQHIWKRIQKTSEFMKSEKTLFSFPGFGADVDIEFTDEAKNALTKTDWVLSFTETLYDDSMNVDLINGTNSSNKYWVRVGDVSILRLKFKTNGAVYDLGVVDNKQSGSENPAGEDEEDQDWWIKIMMMLGMILVAVVLGPFISPLISILGNIVWDGLKFLVRFAFRLITLPFRFIGWLLFRRR